MSAGAAIQVGHFGSTGPVWPSWWRNKLLRRGTLVLLALLPLLAPLLSPADDTHITYPYCALMQLLGALACWKASRLYPLEKVRWETVMLAHGVHAVAYTITWLRDTGVIPGTMWAWLADACLAMCWVLFLPALMGVRAVRSRRVRALDYSLALMTGVVLMRAMGSGMQPDSGPSRVTVILLAMTAIVVAALIARSISPQPGVRLFSSVMFWYMSVSTVLNFVLVVPNMKWLGSSEHFICDVLLVLPQLLLCEWVVAMPRPTMPKTSDFDPLLIDSLQPSIMAFGGVLLALYGFRTHAFFAAAAVILIVLCYALRTHFFYQRLFQQQKELREEAVRFETLATRDALTGVGNRRWFDEEAGKLLAAERSYPCSMLLVDTDNFKAVNDTFGHPVGDEVLRSVASALSEVTAEVKRGCCARIGGDEFGALWPATDSAAASALAERIRKRVEESVCAESIHCSVSLGIATSAGQAHLTELISRADKALYAAKGKGRNAVHALILEKLS